MGIGRKDLDYVLHPLLSRNLKPKCGTCSEGAGVCIRLCGPNSEKTMGKPGSKRIAAARSKP